MNFRIFLYNIKSFNIFQSTQFNQDLQIECVSKPASSQLIELIESWHSIQFNIEASLNDLQAWIEIIHAMVIGSKIWLGQAEALV